MSITIETSAAALQKDTTLFYPFIRYYNYFIMLPLHVRALSHVSCQRFGDWGRLGMMDQNRSQHRWVQVKFLACLSACLLADSIIA